MTPTAEIRLWWPAEPPIVRNWFLGLSGEPIVEDPPRDDLYFLDTRNPGLSVKRRGGRGPLEIKMRVGSMDDYPPFGIAEAWIKTAIDARPVESLAGVAVGKDRLKRTIGVRQASADGPGAFLEFTRVVLVGTEHWSLGVEVPGEMRVLPDVLRAALTPLTAGAPARQLESARSASYPEMISELLAKTV